MNRTLLLSLLIGLGITGAVILHIFRPDANATFTTFIFLLLANIVQAYKADKDKKELANRLEGVSQQTSSVAETTTTIKTNTNGTLTGLLERIQKAEHAARVAETENAYLKAKYEGMI